jgi:hypothetical protein
LNLYGRLTWGGRGIGKKVVGVDAVEDVERRVGTTDGSERDGNMCRCQVARTKGGGREEKAYDIPAVNLTPMDCIENTKTSD